MPSPLPSSTLTFEPVVIGGDNVGNAVAGQIGHRHRKRPLSRGDRSPWSGTSRRDCPAARSRCCRTVGGDDVGDAITGEVSHHDLEGGQVGARGPTAARRSEKVPSPLPSNTVAVSSP